MVTDPHARNNPCINALLQQSFPNPTKTAQYAPPPRRPFRKVQNFPEFGVEFAQIPAVFVAVGVALHLVEGAFGVKVRLRQRYAQIHKGRVVRFHGKTAPVDVHTQRTCRFQHGSQKRGCATPLCSFDVSTISSLTVWEKTCFSPSLQTPTCPACVRLKTQCCKYLQATPVLCAFCPNGKRYKCTCGNEYAAAHEGRKRKDANFLCRKRKRYEKTQFFT